MEFDKSDAGLRSGVVANRKSWHMGQEWVNGSGLTTTALSGCQSAEVLRTCLSNLSRPYRAVLPPRWPVRRMACLYWSEERHGITSKCWIPHIAGSERTGIPNCRLRQYDREWPERNRAISNDCLRSAPAIPRGLASDSRMFAHGSTEFDWNEMGRAAGGHGGAFGDSPRS